MRSLPALLGEQDAVLIVTFAKFYVNSDDGINPLLLGKLPGFQGHDTGKMMTCRLCFQVHHDWLSRLCFAA